MNIKNSIRTLLYLPLIILAVWFMMGFLNMFHPFLDSMSHFRVHFLFLLLLLLLIVAFFHELRILVIYLVLFLVGSFYLYTILQPFQAKPIDITRTQHFKHVQFNLNFKNQRIEEVKTFLKENSIDVVTLQEVTAEHKKALEEMQYEGLSVEFSTDYPYVFKKKGAYPYQQYCNFQAVGGVAILSKYPINKENSICMEGEGLLSSQILVNEKPLNVVSIHLYWPFPYGQTKQVKSINQVFEHLSTPLLIAGDFNAVSWSHTLNQIEKASHTKVINGMRWSIALKEQLPLFPSIKLPIDHVLLSKDFDVDSIYVGEDLGSDHFPVISELRF